MRTVMTIAGSDSCGGAGVQADLKTFSALGVHGSTVITAVTAQNTSGVDTILPLPARTIEEQIRSVMEDMGADAVKTGMLPTPETVKIVSRCVREYGINNVIVDPVTVSQSGDSLTVIDTIRSLTCDLIPLCTLITPNVPEAEVLSGKRITGPNDMVSAARVIHETGADNVLIKGGHFKGEQAGCDLFFDGMTSTFLKAARPLTIRGVHGTGCALSAAIAAFLARGRSLLLSVEMAKEFVTRAIEASYRPGDGSRVVNLLGLVDREE